MWKKHLIKFNNFSDKNTQQTRVEGSFINIIKATYEKPTANILDMERLKVLPLRL